MQRVAKYTYLAWFGGSLYVTLEVFWRSRSHWTMFVLAALLFLGPAVSTKSGQAGG